MEKTRLICIDRHFDAYECEKCHTGWRIEDFSGFKFCPNCGRKIDYNDEIEDGKQHGSSELTQLEIQYIVNEIDIAQERYLKMEEGRSEAEIDTIEWKISSLRRIKAKLMDKMREKFSG